MAAKEKNLKDHEYSMARSEIKTLKNAAKKLEKKMGKRKEGDLEAWVQSKITKAADYIDTASDYVTNESNTNLTIDPKKHREQQRASKIRTLAQQGATAGERKAAENKTKGPKLFGENISLVQKILGEEKCGAGMYWCNTDKVCKPLPSGFDVPGQTKKPTEVGIGKEVSSEGKSCNHTKKGSSCPVHGDNDCSLKEQKVTIEDLFGNDFIEVIDLISIIDEAKTPVTRQAGDFRYSGKTGEEKAERRAKVLSNSPDPKKRRQANTIRSKIKTVADRDTARASSDARQILYRGQQRRANDLAQQLIQAKESVVNEAVRLPSKNGQLMMITFLWRGRTMSIKMFFPQMKLPSRKEIETELKKVYPDAKVIHSTVTFLNSDIAPIPFLQVQEDAINEAKHSSKTKMHSPHEVPSTNLKGLVAKAVKRIDTDVDGDTDNNDKAKGELGEFIPGVGNKRIYSATRTKTAKEEVEKELDDKDDEDDKNGEKCDCNCGKNPCVKCGKSHHKMKEDWQKINKSDKTDGMSPAAVKAYRRENPGSKLKTAVTGDPKPGSNDAKRRNSFCARSEGQQDMHNIDCSKDPDKAICKARRRWKC